MEIVFEGRDSRSWIRACCFSPDGKSFAVASTDNKVYIYDSKSYALKAKVKICCFEMADMLLIHIAVQMRV